jgi:hypothetical protein
MRDPSLSNVELIALARMSCSGGANEDELVAALVEIALPDGSPSVHDQAITAIAVLRRRSLATEPKPTRRAPRPRSKLTDEGRRVLRTAFGLDRTPSWTAVRDRYVPALALGLSAGSEQAGKLGSTEELTLAVLRQHFEISQASTVIALCDSVIAKALGIPAGPITVLRLRAHVLTRALGLDPKVNSTKDLEALATRVAITSQGDASGGKRSLRQVLGHRWVYRVTASASAEQIPSGIPTHAAPPLQPDLHIIQGGSEAAVRPSTPPAPQTSNPPPPPRPPGPDVVAADALLTLVRETIPRIGSDGRFGAEKVFVSAIWHHIERDGRLPELSLDRFKRWLVTFNRDQLLDLARADALGDMDDRLVEESEIKDLNSTFHFVVDRQIAASGRGLHAR